MKIFIHTFFAGALAACGTGGSVTERSPIVADSAGVRIVTNITETRVLAVTESLRLGVIEGPEELQFDRIRSIALEDDGSLWVSDSHGSIRKFDTQGRYVTSAGRRGSGPGESESGYGDIWFGGGELLAVDLSKGALQSFTATGEFIAVQSLTVRSALAIPLVRTNETWLFRTWPLPPTRNADGASTWAVVRASDTRSTLDTLVLLPGDVWPLRADGTRSPPSSFDGSPNLAGSPNAIYYSHPSRYRIEMYDLEGKLRLIVQREITPRGIPANLEAELRSAARDARRRDGRPIAATAAAVDAWVLAALPTSTTQNMPPLGRILSSQDGYLWVERPDLHSKPILKTLAHADGGSLSSMPDDWIAPDMFDLIRQNGEYIGTVELPYDFIPMVATRNSVYGRVRDELDVEYVVKLSVLRS